MINSTFGGFMTARQGMAASQHGLNLTGHNLTNSATEGYTRQRIDQVSLNFNGTYRYASQYNVNVGNGVLVTGTSQLRDPFLDLRYRNEVAHVGEHEVELEVLGDLQNILDEVRNMGDDTLGNGGIFNQLGDILAKLQQLSNEVGNKEFDTMVRSSCQALTTLFHDYDKRIQEVEDNLAYDLENVDVPRVNKILTSIRDLNKTIKSNEIMGNSALELKDQRNLLIDELAGYMKINVLYKPVKVSDSTTVDELTISMVTKDGNKIPLVADEQMRQLELKQDANGDWQIGLTKLDPDDVELTSALNNAKRALSNLPQKLGENYEAAAATFQKAINKQKNLQDAVTEAQKAITDLPADADQETKDKAQAALTKAQETLAAYTDGDYKTAKDAYQAAVDALPTATDTITDANGNDVNALKAAFNGNIPNKLPDGTTPVAGNGTAFAEAVNTAKDKITAAQQALDASIAAGAAMPPVDDNGNPLKPINTLLVDGSLKGTLEMLNYAGEYDTPGENPANIRGIGYFHNMLDTLANQFATMMNKANGSGNPLFKANDNSDFIDAGNIALADGWVNNTYGITASTKQDAPSGSNDNILHMISLFGEKMEYTTELYKKDGTKDQNGTPLFNGTFEEFFTNIGNVLGLDIQSTTEKLDNYSQLASTLAQNREAVTGVSLDEEAMNIMRYQQSYNASARLMTALDEMLTTLISNTGVAGR